jgi:hypothetical protein
MSLLQNKLSRRERVQDGNNYRKKVRHIGSKTEVDFHVRHVRFFGFSSGEKT